MAKYASAMLICACLLSGQDFEVASVRPSGTEGGPIGLWTYPGGRIVITQYTLQQMVMEALDVQSYQVSGGPRWVQEDRFNVVATPPASSLSSKSNPNNPKLPPNAEQRRMLLSLLKERFQLKFHRETKEGPVFLLTKGNKPSKLQPSANKDEFPWAGTLDATHGSGILFKGENISMAQLARRLTGWLVRPVFDRTGVEGSFDFQDEYSSDDTRVDRVAAIVASVSAIGLKLESAKGPVERIVIDSAEKPAEN